MNAARLEVIKLYKVSLSKYDSRSFGLEVQVVNNASMVNAHTVASFFVKTNAVTVMIRGNGIPISRHLA